MKKVITGFLLTGMLALAGCASVPPGNDQAKTVPDSRIFAEPPLLNKEPGDSLLLLKTDYAKWMDDYLFGQDVYLNGVKVASMYPGEKIMLYVKPGKYSIRTENNNIIDWSAGRMQVDMRYNDFQTYVLSSATLSSDMKIIREIQ